MTLTYIVDITLTGKDADLLYEAIDRVRKELTTAPYVSYEIGQVLGVQEEDPKPVSIYQGVGR